MKTLKTGCLVWVGVLGFITIITTLSALGLLWKLISSIL